MGRKALGLLLGFLVVAGLLSGIHILSERIGGGTGDVQWSPLYTSRERSALQPVTSQVVYAGQARSLAAPTCFGVTCEGTCDEATCDDTCQDTCQKTCDGYTCEGTCDRTCQDTCQTTCDGYTCEGTCDGNTCEGTCDAPTCQATCDGRTCEGTCDGYTCEGTCDEYTCDRTCQDTCQATCDGYTCEGTCDEYTCEGTCEGSTCQETCDGYTCEGTCDEYTCECTCSATCDGETCDGSTCEGETCDGATCPRPTCSDHTCVGPTCSGFATCDVSCEGSCSEATWDVRTCEGPTCGGVSCGGFTCDPWDCEVPTCGGPTCARPTCDGPTCAGPTCEGETCEMAECHLWDFGDAPDDSIFGVYRYTTRLEDDGARHRIRGLRYLGDDLDREPDGQPQEEALGDDMRPWSVYDDEDGVWIPTSLVPGQQAILIAQASVEGFFHGWIDYDADGNWRAREDRLFEPSVPLQRGFNWIAFEVPEEIEAPATSYARFRFGSQQALTFSGEARDGEVEDYVTALCPAYDVWVMTDDIVYRPGRAVELVFYVDSTSQVEILRHAADGRTTVVWSGTVESGRHELVEYGPTLPAGSTIGTHTIELIATSVPKGCTTWVTTPFVVIEP